MIAFPSMHIFTNNKQSLPLLGPRMRIPPILLKDKRGAARGDHLGGFFLFVIGDGGVFFNPFLWTSYNSGNKVAIR